ncbi:MAG: hypothetical protein J2P17_19250 [Mycobacterium sp.]|nr:hypothetical protein [Mycobacterium sp.]
MIAKWYTRASRVRIVIAKFDGRWRYPGGPYPIPEFVALVGGILATLMLLPRLGNPFATGFVGVVATAAAVGVMRRMPYSPVKFTTRVHRIWRLYTSPISLSVADTITAGNTMSVVRPQIDILDVLADDVTMPGRRHLVPAPPPQSDPWEQMFDHQPSPAADLFG